ncbi:MAG: hypothetical protein JXR63_05645 [Spirochaetales bacterium]|nr:hypothetical protein [Spirochaetales bacterium]
MVKKIVILLSFTFIIITCSCYETGTEIEARLLDPGLLTELETLSLTPGIFTLTVHQKGIKTFNISKEQVDYKPALNEPGKSSYLWLKVEDGEIYVSVQFSLWQSYPWQDMNMTHVGTNYYLPTGYGLPVVFDYLLGVFKCAYLVDGDLIKGKVIGAQTFGNEIISFEVTFCSEYTLLEN